MMNPVIERRKKDKIGKFPLFTGRLNFLFILGINVEHSPWNNLTTIVNPNNLAFEQMTLFTLKVRIGINLLLQIPSENILDISGNVNLVRRNQRQFLPITTEQIRRYPVGHFVDACPARLNIRRKFTVFSPL
jgi:hypothetical protein